MQVSKKQTAKGSSKPENNSSNLAQTGKINGRPFSLDGITLHSSAACLRVYWDGEFVDLLNLRKNEKVYAASLTKIMTLLTSHELIKVNGRNLSEMATVKAVDLAGLSEKNSSVMGLEEGERISLEDLLYGLILPSGADAGRVLARELSGGINEFVETMNAFASKLCLSGTHFTNTSGLFHLDNVTTMSDMAELLHHVWREPFLRKILSSRSHRTKPSAAHPDGIAMVHTIESTEIVQGIQSKIIDGAKTGYLPESGYCLASFKSFGNGLIILTTSGAFRQEDNILDHISLYQALSRQWPKDGLSVTLEEAPDISQRHEPSVHKTKESPSSSRKVGGVSLQKTVQKNSATHNNRLTTIISAVIAVILLLLALALLISLFIRSKNE